MSNKIDESNYPLVTLDEAVLSVYNISELSNLILEKFNLSKLVNIKLMNNWIILNMESAKKSIDYNKI